MKKHKLPKKPGKKTKKKTDGPGDIPVPPKNGSAMSKLPLELGNPSLAMESSMIGKRGSSDKPPIKTGAEGYHLSDMLVTAEQIDFENGVLKQLRAKTASFVQRLSHLESRHTQLKETVAGKEGQIDIDRDAAWIREKVGHAFEMRREATRTPNVHLEQYRLRGLVSLLDMVQMARHTPEEAELLELEWISEQMQMLGKVLADEARQLRSHQAKSRFQILADTGKFGDGRHRMETTRSIGTEVIDIAGT